MRKLLVFGDSWTAGTWLPDGLNKNKIDQPGLQYLNNYYNLINLSRPGGSNWQTLYAIKSYFDHTEVVDTTLVLACQTDLFRDQMSELFDVKYQSLYFEASNLENFYERACELFYYKIDMISKIINKKIYLIGGLSDVNKSLLTSITDNVEVISSSWIKLFYNQHNESIVPIVIHKDFMPVARKHDRLDLALEASEYSDKNFSKFLELQESKYMSNFIGDFHPTIDGHNIMSKYILNYFKELV
jgi:hypothetical protein